MVQFLRLLGAICFFGFYACSRSDVAGGNSAESGNPEIAGVLRLPDGSAAAGAEVRCVPSSFNPLEDAVGNLKQARADSSGAFSLYGLESGNCALEAHDSSSGSRLLSRGLAVREGQTLRLDDTLQAPGTLRLGLQGFAEGVAGRVVVPGTSIARRVVVKYASVYVDSLPAGTVGPLYFHPDSGSALLLQDSGTVISNDTVPLSAAPVHVSTRIALNTGAKGCDLRETLYGFALALRLDSSDLDFSVVSPGNGRLRVWEGDSSRELPFALEYWGAKGAALWVRLYSLLPQQESQSLILSWDEGDTASNASSPFQASDGVLAAWHFTGGEKAFADAGPYGYGGEGVAVSDAPGAVGRGLYFDGLTSYVGIPGSETGHLDFGFVDTMTWSVWVRLDNANTSRFVFGKGTYQYYLKYLHPNGWVYEYDDEQPLASRYWSEAPLDTLTHAGGWSQLAVVQQGTQARFYVNGVLQDSLPAHGLNPDSVSRYTGSPFQIGRRLYPDGRADQYFQGVMDELIVSDRARSAEWIRLSHLNQQPEGYWP